MPRTPPSSSPPPARPGPPCTKAREHRAGTKRVLGDLFAAEIQPAVRRGSRQHALAERFVVAVDRSDEAALPEPQPRRFVTLLDAFVCNERRHRAEDFHVVQIGRRRIVRSEQRGRDEPALLACATLPRSPPVTTRACFFKRSTPACTSFSCCAVTSGPIFTSLCDGSPTTTSCSRSAKIALDVFRDASLADDHAPRRRALFGRSSVSLPWPARARTSRTVSLPCCTSGPSTAAFKLSASMFTRTECFTTF